MLNSNQFDPKSFASCSLPAEESFKKCDCSDFEKGGFDMKVEQSKDDDIMARKVKMCRNIIIWWND